WHATDQGDSQERPRWAVLFGGMRYVVFLFVYVTDDNEKLRPALFCSPVMNINRSEFPICTVTLYMTLTSSQHIEQATLLEKLDIQTPTSPDALPPEPQLPTSTRANARGLRKVTFHGFTP